MLLVEEAHRLLLENAPPRRVVRLPVADSLGLVLAADLRAPVPLPPFARSAMDGFALRSADTAGATRDEPVLLPVSGVVPAGHPLPGPLAPGACVAIMTGGPLPAGADAVIRLEEVQGTDRGALFVRPASVGENVARPGEDVAAGEVVLGAGACIRPAEITLLAAVGVADVPVFAPPRVGILCTGDELVPAGAVLGPGQIYNGNGPGLAAMVRAAGCSPVDLGVARDAAELIAGALGRAADCDLILTSGGVSVGEYDVVREALAVMGARELFWRVAVKPGTPVCAALMAGRLMIGLSGNPSAAIVNFDVLVRPLLDHLCGRARLGLREAEAVLDQPVLRVLPLTRFLRSRAYVAATGQLRADTDLAQKAGILSSMAQANAYAVIPAGAGPLPAGSRVRVLLHEGTELPLYGTRREA